MTSHYLALLNFFFYFFLFISFENRCQFFLAFFYLRALWIVIRFTYKKNWNVIKIDVLNSIMEHLLKSLDCFFTPFYLRLNIFDPMLMIRSRLFFLQNPPRKKKEERKSVLRSWRHLLKTNFISKNVTMSNSDSDVFFFFFLFI